MLLPLEPSQDKKRLRRQLQAERISMLDRPQREIQLQEVLRVWLIDRTEQAIGVYWPIKAEFNALPAMFRWAEADVQRIIGLPVIDRNTRQLRFHSWWPGCPMEDDAFGIPKPKDTPEFKPELLLIPCVGYGPQGVRLGYGGGFYDRSLATLHPRPMTVGLAYTHGYIPWLQAEPHDIPLDTILTEDGVVWSHSGTG